MLVGAAPSHVHVELSLPLRLLAPYSFLQPLTSSLGVPCNASPHASLRTHDAAILLSNGAILLADGAASAEQGNVHVLEAAALHQVGAEGRSRHAGRSCDAAEA